MSNSDRRLQIHTLGPTGTNCEAAAHYYLGQHDHKHGSVVLHNTLESAVESVLADPADRALLGCVVYPRLHEIVFQNLSLLSLRECFVMPTHRMVLAAPDPGPVSTVLSHPAPVNLLDGRDLDIRLVSSNSAAASECAAGNASACITTSVAAEANGLEILEDFGPVPMGFTIHAPYGTLL